MNSNEARIEQPAHQVLIVADRTADTFSLVRVLRERARTERIEATVVVPASLHGLEWVGDPRATIPDAERHAALLQAALLNAGVASCEAEIGDPDPHAAVDDALGSAHFDEVLISLRSPRLASAFHLGLADRIALETDAGISYLRPSRRRHRRRRVAA